VHPGVAGEFDAIVGCGEYLESAMFEDEGEPFA
jgi:hypothetical protein